MDAKNYTLFPKKHCYEHPTSYANPCQSNNVAYTKKPTNTRRRIYSVVVLKLCTPELFQRRPVAFLKIYPGMKSKCYYIIPFRCDIMIVTRTFLATCFWSASFARA